MVAIFCKGEGRIKFGSLGLPSSCVQDLGSPIFLKIDSQFLEEEDVNVGSCEVLVNDKYKVNEKVHREAAE